MVKKCPKCGSTELVLAFGAITGQYVCKKCGYVGPLVVEKYEKDEGSKGDENKAKK